MVVVVVDAVDVVVAVLTEVVVNVISVLVVVVVSVVTWKYLGAAQRPQGLAVDSLAVHGQPSRI